MKPNSEAYLIKPWQDNEDSPYMASPRYESTKHFKTPSNHSVPVSIIYQ